MNARIAIYGDVNANIVDGSSVWLRNISLLCSNTPNLEVDLFLKAPIVRNHILDELDKIDNLKILEPSAEALNGSEVLKPQGAVDLICRRDKSCHYIAIVLRGAEVCLVASEEKLLKGRVWAYLTDIPQSFGDLSEDSVSKLKIILDSSKYLLCQTEEIRTFIGNVIQGYHHKLALLPPMVPGEAFSKNANGSGVNIFYSGKFAPAWAVEQLVDFSKSIASLSVTVAGDKFHRVPGDSAYEERLKFKFRNTDNVEWLGAVTPSRIFDMLPSMSMGFAWRLPEMDASLELSTKLLEYGAAGLAVITNPTTAHINLLGNDYPFFASNESELLELLQSLPGREQEIRSAGELCQAVAKSFSISSLQNNWTNLVNSIYRFQSLGADKNLNVVLAGHDLKFSKELIEYFNSRPDVTLRIDHWKSLREHDEKVSLELAQWADIVFCEWCAGNSVWYSENIDVSNTKLFVRFHRIEIMMEFAPKVLMGNVEKIFFVGPHFLRQAKEKFSWPEDKLVFLPNFVDVDFYSREKFLGASYNLGLIGFVPKLKRLDRALDILRELRKRDSRYTLFVKGRFPWEYPWIWRREEEKAFYESCFKKIKEDPWLKDAVVFDPFGDDIALWLRKIGIILSVSDLESFHMALAEGISSNAYPLLWRREGSEELFPWIQSGQTAAELADMVYNQTRDSQSIKNSLIERYSMERTREKLDFYIC